MYKRQEVCADNVNFMAIDKIDGEIRAEDVYKRQVYMKTGGIVPNYNKEPAMKLVNELAEFLLKKECKVRCV